MVSTISLAGKNSLTNRHPCPSPDLEAALAPERELTWTYEHPPIEHERPPPIPGTKQGHSNFGLRGLSLCATATTDGRLQAADAWLPATATTRWPAADCMLLLLNVTITRWPAGCYCAALLNYQFL
ncbi:hypothetical protein BDA96_04G242400 [Sorghum bicolor]|uniref:Uncharacterized protein n=2 Tax=Sorghum bicolor TaxID=4558 RepID=A0A921R627_SORBI|nr:hypothetical protein BDA96_04G242400 [Sorghum bicolor]OQU85376.1 hypothetical protein SORBI_3004G227550 [Sorghum bicolor]